MAFTKIAASGISSSGSFILQNINSTGVITATSIVATTGTFNGNVSIAGTLTYEDVTNIDSLGIVTARAGVKVLAGGIDAVGVITASAGFSGNVNSTGVSTFSTILVGTAVTISGGIVTATSFRGDGSQLTGIAATTNVRTNSLVVSGMTTATGGIQVGATTSIVVGNTFLKATSIGIGTTTTAGRNAGINTAEGTLIYNATTTAVECYFGNSAGWLSVKSGFSASGGTESITSRSGYKVHTFTSPGTFTVSSGTVTVEYLVIGGVGSGVAGVSFRPARFALDTFAMANKCETDPEVLGDQGNSDLS